MTKKNILTKKVTGNIALSLLMSFTFWVRWFPAIFQYYAIGNLEPANDLSEVEAYFSAYFLFAWLFAFLIIAMPCQGIKDHYLKKYQKPMNRIQKGLTYGLYTQLLLIIVGAGWGMWYDQMYLNTLYVLFPLFFGVLFSYLGNILVDKHIEIFQLDII